MNSIMKEEIKAFKNLPMITEAYISQIQVSDLDLKRSKESWTIREHVYHLVDVQKMLLQLNIDNQSLYHYYDIKMT